LLAIFSYLLKNLLLKISVFVVGSTSLRHGIVENVTQVYSSGINFILWLGAFVLTLVGVYLLMRVLNGADLSRNFKVMIFMMAYTLLIAVMLLTLSTDYIRITRNVAVFVYVLTAIYFDKNQFLYIYRNRLSIGKSQFQVLSVSVLFMLGNLIAQVFVFYPGAKVFFNAVLHI
jgi:hypothetical protein